MANYSDLTAVTVDETTITRNATGQLKVKDGILPLSYTGTGATGNIAIPATAKKIIITGSHSTNLTVTFANVTSANTRVLYADAGSFAAYATYRFDATGEFVSESIISKGGLVVGGWVMSATQNRFGHLFAACSARPTTLSFTADSWTIQFEY